MGSLVDLPCRSIPARRRHVSSAAVFTPLLTLPSVQATPIIANTEFRLQFAAAMPQTGYNFSSLHIFFANRSPSTATTETAVPRCLLHSNSPLSACRLQPSIQYAYLRPSIRPIANPRTSCLCYYKVGLNGSTQKHQSYQHKPATKAHGHQDLPTANKMTGSTKSDLPLFQLSRDGHSMWQ
jgi:hypothetical protein